MAAPMPATLRAPLLLPLPLKEPVGMTVEELEEEELVKGVDFGVEVVLERETEDDGFPVPEEVELEREEEEEGSAMSNAGVWLNTKFTFPTGEA